MRRRVKAVKYYRKLKGYVREKTAAEAVGEKYSMKPSTIRKYDKILCEQGKRGLLPEYRVKDSHVKTPFYVIEIILLLRVLLKWGGLRISQELAARGIYTISHTAIYKLFRRYHIRTRTYHPRGKRNGINYKRYEAKKPNDLWHMDLAGPFETPQGEKLYVLIIIDDYSRFLIDLRVVSSLETEPIINILKEQFQILGKPKAIMTDNATTFVSTWEESNHCFTSFLENEGIKHKRIQPYYPETNGKAEAAVKITKKEAICPFLTQQTQWNKDDLQNILNKFRTYYNTNRLHGGIGWITPHQRFTGKKPALGGINTIFRLDNLNLPLG